MKDTIYRKDVTELIKKNRNSTDWDEADAGAFFHWTAKLSREIDKLPSAERTGKWIWDEDGVEGGIGAWTCSKCEKAPNTWWEIDEKVNPLMCSGGSFCGNCGVRMVRK